MADGGNTNGNNEILLARLDERTGQIQADIKDIKDGLKANNALVQQHDRDINELKHWRGDIDRERAQWAGPVQQYIQDILDLKHWRTEQDAANQEHKDDMKRITYPFLNWLIVAVVLALAGTVGAYLLHLLTFAH